LERYFDRSDKNFGIRLLPDRDRPVEISPKDRLIVISEDEI
jgi:hypothetical protein